MFRVNSVASVSQTLRSAALSSIKSTHFFRQPLHRAAFTTAPSQSDAVKPATPSVFPGIVAAAAVMHVGFYGADIIGPALLSMQGLPPTAANPVSGVPLAILSGVALSNLPLVRSVFASSTLTPGLKWCSTMALRAGIICIGAKLSAFEIASFGMSGLPVVAVAVATGLTVVPWLGRLAGLSPKLSSLIAAGTSICGVTAITACAPAIRANQQEISFAVANVVAFGTLGMLVYPHLAPMLFSNSQAIGVFLGIAVHDTSQVMGAALTYSNMFADELALKVAAITKLSRNVLLAVVVPLFSYREQVASGAVPNSVAGAGVLGTLKQISKYIPLFVVGFLGAAALRTIGDAQLASGDAALFFFDQSQWTRAHSVVANQIGAHYLLGTAMAAVGLSTKLSDLRGVGWRPFAVGLGGALSVAAAGALTLALVQSMKGNEADKIL